MSLNDKYSIYAYLDDEGSAYSVKLSDAIAASGGFTQKVNPNLYPVWPYGRLAMRWGEYVDDDDHLLHLPICRPDDALWNAEADIVHRNRIYRIIGFRGESKNKASVE